MLFLKQFFTFLFIVVLICLFNYAYVHTGTIGIDDGNIFLNYAHHLANGEGFVFNTNDEKVEGFTSLLWVIVCALFYLFTAHPEIPLICFSALLTTLTITYVYRAIKHDIDKAYPGFSRYYFWLYGAFIFSIGPSFIAWNVLSLMENPLWNFLFTWLIISMISTLEPGNIAMRKKILIIIAACLLTLARPEALMWNLFFFCLLLYTFIKNKRGIIYPLAYLFFAGITTIALTVFRVHTFGFRLPNTYYAKVSPDRLYNFVEGAKYAFNFLTGYQPAISFLFVLMSMVLLFSLFKLKLFTTSNYTFPNPNIIQKSSVVTIIIITGIALPCTTGGDHFGGFRFYQDLLLLFSWGILIIIWLWRNYGFYRNNIKLIGAGSIITFLLLIGCNDLIDLKNPARTQLNFEFLLAQQGRDLANTLNNTFVKNKPAVGMVAVGGFGLLYEGKTVDLMGLNNILMGHSPGDRKGIKNHAAFNKDVFYKLNPDVLLPVSVNGKEEAVIKYNDLLDENDFDNQAMKDIFKDAPFKKIYSPVFILNKPDNTGVFAFVRIDYMNVLSENSNISIEEIQKN